MKGLERVTDVAFAGISMCMWNVNGMFNKSLNYQKMNDDLFINEVKNHDIIALVETQTGPDDHIILEGFYPAIKADRPKPKGAPRHFGGIAVLVKQELRKGIKFLEHRTQDYIWLKLCKEFFHLNNDIFVCVAYIPPCNSQYLNKFGDNILNYIQEDCAKYSRVGEIVLTGDLNARTGIKPDFVVGDNDKNVPLDLNYIMDKNMPVRNSFDSKVDKRGNEILDLCVSARLRILNGRKAGDSLGYFTCHKWNGNSVVDYALVSEGLFDEISYFKVSQAFLDISDHCMIAFKIKTPAIKVQKHTNILNALPAKFKWDNESIFRFQTALISQEVQNKISSFLAATYTSTEIAAESVVNILKTAAENSLKMKSNRQITKRKNNNNWHNNSLKQIRNKLTSKGNLLITYPNDPIIRGSYFKCLKYYRKECKKAQRQFRHDIILQLESLHEINPKGYWDLLKKLKNETTDNVSKISAEEWLTHFGKLNQKENFREPNHIAHIKNELKRLENIPNFTNLDFKIKTNEILKAIKTLKNNKACGLDSIQNEFIKYGQHVLLPVLHKLFNMVLTSGAYPQIWAEGYLKPLHKKENPLLPNNYRGIAITSVVGKLFNAVINNRIEVYIEQNNILRPEQIGFRKKCRTADHIFVLKTLIQKYKKDRKAIYACFIDLEKAFDSVWHEALFYKLLKIGMNGRVYNIIKSMYSKVKLQVHVGSGLTSQFTSNIGVRQGDNLSPALFNLFINDIPNSFNQECDPVRLDSLSINSLLYADDLVILAETASGLKVGLNKMNCYCHKWGLKINAKKTKVIVFNPPKKIDEKFTMENIELELVHEVTYLGIVLTKNGSFQTSQKLLYNKGLKALFKLKKQLTPLPNIKCCLHLFEHLVKPVLLYCSEIWAYSMFGERNHTKLRSNNIETLYSPKVSPGEKIITKYAKSILNVNSKTDNLGVYGELGIFPLYIDALDRMLKYWTHIESGSPNIILKDAFRCSQKLHNNGVPTWFTFALNVKNSLFKFSNGLSPSKIEHTQTKKILKKRYKKFWKHQIMDDTQTKSQHGSKLRTFRSFKHSHKLADYLTTITNPKTRSELSRFRLSSHKLMIEVGRHTNIELGQRVCPKCDTQAVEDEKHFLLECPFYNADRAILLNIVKSVSPHIENLTQSDQFIWIMSCQTNNIITSLGAFISNSMKRRFPHSQEDE
jgi:hypothetical protein